MTMAMRKHIIVLQVALATLFVTLFGAGEAAADTQWEWRPRVSAVGGYDDNIKIDGSGGDGFGQIAPGLKLDIFGEHQLRAAFDCQVGLARLANPNEFGFTNSRVFANEDCNLNTRVNLSERDKFFFRVDTQYAQDPLALAGVGLLLRPGQTTIFVGRMTVEDTHALSGHTDLSFGMDGTILTFGSNDPGNNFVVAPRARYEWKTSQRAKWDAGLREQLFFGIGQAATGGTEIGLLGEGHSFLVGYTYELTAWSDVTVRGGPAAVTGQKARLATEQGTAVMPTLRAELNGYTPAFDVRLTFGHDLVIGPSGGGALVGDIAEVGFTRRWEQLQLHLRVGAYRNADIYNQWQAGSSGYGGEAGADWYFTRDLRFGISAERDARLYDPNTNNNLVDRDVVQVRFTYEKAHFN
jgi:hypothetical protein